VQPGSPTVWGIWDYLFAHAGRAPRSQEERRRGGRSIGSAADAGLSHDEDSTGYLEERPQHEDTPVVLATQVALALPP